MGYGSKALQLLRDYFEKKFTSGISLQKESTLINMFKETEENESDGNDENDVRPAKGLPPLLCRLNERKPESLDYLGVSYGLNVNLLKFWKKNGFIACYLRAVPNELTGDHTCIMLKDLRGNDNGNLYWKGRFRIIPISFSRAREKGWLDLRLFLGISTSLHFNVVIGISRVFTSPCVESVTAVV